MTLANVVPLSPVQSGAGVLRLEAVYRAQASWVVQTLGRLGVADADHDDLAHDIFVIVQRKLPDFDPERAVRPWLFGIAFRVVSAHRKRARHRYEVSGDEALQAPDLRDGPEARTGARRRLRIVAAALGRLNDTRRAVFVMHDIDGFTIPEIAVVIEAPTNTLYSHLRRARETFTAAVRELGPTSEDET